MNLNHLALSLALTFGLCSLGHAARPDHAGGGRPDGVGNAGKVELCHNGDTYDIETQEEVAVSYVISVNRNALRAHLNNHGDCDSLFEQGDPISVCELNEEADLVVCEEKVSCECIDPEDPEPEA